jgi:hypothetical protein
MKKRYWVILLVVFICLDIIIFYIFSPSSLQNIISPSPEQQEGNETQNPWRFPKITFPWSSEEPSGGAGGAGGTGGEGGAEGTGGEGTELPVIKNNYTLFVNSTHNLEVLVTYTVNNIVFNETISLPFSLEVQEDAYACLSETTGSGTIRWLMENEIDCPFSDCAGNPYGCSILMDRNHSVTLRQYT